MQRFFAPCPRGLEEILASELRALRAADVQSTEGGVSFGGTYALAYRANLESRIASRILWQVAHERYRDETDIYELALAQPWHQWFAVERTIRVSTTAIRSPLKSLEFTTLRVKDAVCDRFRKERGTRPSVDTGSPDMRIHVFLTSEHCTLYLDTSGEALFKRGYRQTAGEAPLRENLAAGILRLIDWREGEVLLDPFCGSGTLLIEAALMALKRAPGNARAFAFRHLSWHDPSAWQRIVRHAREQEEPVRPLALFGSDHSQHAARSTLENLRAAGVAGAAEIETCDVLDRTAPAAAGTIVTNPPYGMRQATVDELAHFYPRLGDVLKQRFTGWTAHILSADTRLPKLIGLKPHRRIPLFNGSLECRLYAFRLVTGRLREARTSRAV